MLKQNNNSISLPAWTSNVSLQYRNKMYIASRVFPFLDNVPAHGAKILSYDRGPYFSLVAGGILKGDRTAAKRITASINTVDISTKPYAVATEITANDKRIATAMGSNLINLVTDATEFATDVFDRHFEKDVADVITAATWIDGVSGGEDAAGLWSPNDATNTFITDILTGIKTIHKAVGVRPNRLIMDYDTYSALSENTALLARIGGVYTATLDKPTLVTATGIAALFGLDECIIAEAIYSTAQQKADGTDFTAKYIWDTANSKGMGFLYYAPNSPSLKQVSAGYICRSPFAGSGLLRELRTWNEPAANIDVIEVSQEHDIKIATANAGYLWKDTHTT